MAQQERAVRTRRAVLEAAATVFAEHGYAAATVADILKLAGLTKGALYFHFPSKEALAQGILEAQVPQQLIPQELKLQEWVDAGMTLAHQLPRDPVLRAGARLSAEYTGDEQHGSAFPAWIAFSASLLDQAKRNGEVLGHVEPTETAECLLGSFHGVQLFSQLQSNWADIEQRASVLFRHVLPAIAVPSALVRLDTAPDRGARVVAELKAMAAEQDGLVPLAG
ncbi:gamma-butyrolactone-binding protein [Streptomyces cellostaticus]|uniref:Gamma-butyrolactone-binding protein n=1 Tax=Streptomyces cellostaticus TaxID=67285 RepID=A0A117PRX9_9ACTN|nr:ScbR family autoregulator-binding transcription factor [Streptomyces cellostaticus]KUM88373.1 gamma-butyrolactone-binding protein [Streptomyces cellostaticus]GHI10394.1 gamma-butyrolactone-binding protein [Streptomyces cellostaticus]